MMDRRAFLGTLGLVAVSRTPQRSRWAGSLASAS